MGSAHIDGSGLTHIFNYNIRIIYIIILYIIKKIKKIKTPFKKVVIFSHVFLPVLHNIGLYIYTVRYRSSIKYPIFSKIFQKNSKQNLKTFKLISLKKIFCFHVYD
jgi:hypothetical protein